MCCAKDIVPHGGALHCHHCSLLFDAAVQFDSGQFTGNYLRRIQSALPGTVIGLPSIYPCRGMPRVQCLEGLKALRAYSHFGWIHANRPSKL